MSIFLVNLGFSIQGGAPNSGNFQADNQNTNPLLRSCVWLQYSAGALLPNDTFYQITVALTPSQWTYLSGTSSSLQVNNNDIVLIRIFNADGVNPNETLRLAAVFGQGTSSELVGPPTVLQSPLVVNNLPRTLLDSVDLSAQVNPQNWAAPSSDGAWTFVVGMIHGANNQYSFNVGASVCLNPSLGSPVYQYGHDPKMRVGMGRAQEHAA